MSGIMNMLVAAKTTIAAAIDAYFNNTTLLLNTSSTNGAQNNTFLDSSTNNFTITRNGNTTQGTFTPFSQTGWSNYFNGSTDYLSIADSSLLELSNSSFTIEAWVWTNSTVNQTIITKRNGTADENFILYLSAGTAVQLFCSSNGTSFDMFSAASIGTISLNTWNHISVQRSGNNWYGSINGTITSLGSNSSTVFNNASPWLIGADIGANRVTGYISNTRIVIGSAVYGSSNFTPPSVPLTPISGTQLLTCQSNRFLDTSSNAFAITVAGNTSVQAFSPFAPTAAYDTAVVGGSAYFDGSGDYLGLTGGTNLAFGTGDFTIEFFANITVNGVFYDSRPATTDGVYVTIAASDFPSASASSVSLVVSGAKQITGTASIKDGAWHHIALCRSSGVTRLFVDGVQTGSSYTDTNSYLNGASRPLIASQGYTAGSSAPTGYISGLRVLKGTGIYTTTFTPPTAPPTAITNTQLLLNFTNAGIFDSTAKNVLETVGNAQVSTTQAKWGTTSLYCPATNGNYFISPPNQQNFIFGTGNFTVEAWVYPTAFTNTATGLIGYGLSGGYVDWNLEINTSGTVLYIDNDTGRFSSSSNLSTNAWTHIAIVRTNTAVTMYFNGTSVGSYSTINNITGNSSSARLYVGTGAQTPGSRQFIGYIDDPRISKYARYTTTFTPPTAAFPLL